MAMMAIQDEQKKKKTVQRIELKLICFYSCLARNET